MADHLGFYNTSSSRTTVRFAFTTHAATGAPVAPSSAFEAADLIIYKDGSDTQRTSANGVTMTSPFDSITGLHHVSIDLTDNTDSGFYAAGSWYMVVLSPDETVDSLAVAKVLAYFEIGVAKADVTQFAGTAITSASGIPEVKVASIANNAITAASIATDAIDADAIAADAIGSSELAAGAATEIATAVWASGTRELTALDEDNTTIDLNATTIGAVAGAVGSVTGNVGGNVVGSVGSVTGAVGSVTGAVGSVTGNVGGNVTGSVGSVAAGGITAASIATDAIDADALASDAVTEIADGLLKRDLSAVTGEASRSLLNAVRFLRNKFSISGGTLTVYKEDDATSAWTGAVTTTAGDPVSQIDPT